MPSPLSSTPEPIDDTYKHSQAVTVGALDLRPRGVDLGFPQN